MYKKIKNIVNHKIISIFHSSEGMGVVEVAVIIVILVGLALIFRNTINTVLGKILDSINIDEVIGG